MSVRDRRYHYEPGCTRWIRILDRKDPKEHRPPQGWCADIVEMDHHPITFNRLQCPQTWVRETYIGAEE